MSPAAKEPDQSSYSGRFAARLRMLREKTGLTGKEAVAELNRVGYGVKQTTYYNWESGRSEPPLDAYPELAKMLGLSSPRTLLPNE
ncbi:MAG TPA: hypothetical protein DDW52_26995 [Planctomycetaceae bacterium]|nr:hypothetical protein [Planctomycetaceae bacterium]